MSVGNTGDTSDSVSTNGSSADDLPRRQYSIRQLFWLVLIFSLLFEGARVNWPDYLGIVWVGLLTYLVFTTCRQVIWLCKKEHLPFDPQLSSIRWTWISCRVVGASLVTMAILNRFDMASQPTAETVNSLNPMPYDINLIMSHMMYFGASRSFLGPGILLCMIPLWRIRRTVRTPAKNHWVTNLGSALALTFAFLVLMQSLFESQWLNSVIYISVQGIDMAQSQRLGTTELFESDSDWIANRYDFLHHCSWLAAAALLMLISFGFQIRSRGWKKILWLVSWLIGAVFSWKYLVWIYSGGTDYLGRSWKFAVGVPGSTAIVFVSLIGLLGGFVIAFILGVRRSDKTHKLAIDKLVRYTPYPILSFSIAILLFIDTFSWTTMGGWFASYEPGVIRNSIQQLFFSGFGIIWALVFALIAVGHWNLRFWDKRSMSRLQPYTTATPVVEFIFNWAMASVTSATVALGLGWFAFAAIIGGTKIPALNFYELFLTEYLDRAHLQLAIVSFVALALLGAIVVFRLFHKRT